MVRKSTKGLGGAITNDRKKTAQKLREQAEALANNSVAQESTSKSVLEQSSLDELIATVELRKEHWTSVVGEAEYVAEGPSIVSTVVPVEAERTASSRRGMVSIPRRPAWHEGMSQEELAKAESESFMDWRRSLALAAQSDGLYLTPYERNLDFWRQLWRCMERSDLLVQIVDARDPDFYYCQDLARYLSEFKSPKRLLLLVNKADFLAPETRERWMEHFASRGIDAVFFSALRELRRQPPVPGAVAAEAKDPAEVQEPLAPEDVPVPDESDEESEGQGAEPQKAEDREEPPEESPLGPLKDDDLGVLDASELLDELVSRLPKPAQGAAAQSTGTLQRRGTVGFVGYPNVGKSTVINALMGAKRVAMSKRPGKTKHIQTMELPSYGITLCDCPGLVFPSVAATRAHLVINNTMPLDDLRECFSPVGLIIAKVGFAGVLSHYDCAKAVKEARDRSGDHVLDDTHAFLAALAVSRGHSLRVHVPDENWAARKVLRDYVSGRLLHCELPPTAVPEKAEAAPKAVPADAAVGPAASDGADEEEEDDDFGDVGAFLEEMDSARRKKEKPMTKRQMRMLGKKMLKSGQVEVAGAIMRREVQPK